MINSNIISNNFAKSAKTYDSNAYFQKYASKQLANVIKEKSSQINTIFEIGCGTGFLTKELLEIFKNKEFLISDISDKMLKETIANTADFIKINKKINYQLCDVTGDLPNKPFDLITSGLTFQWLENDLSQHLKRLKNNLNDNGYIIFSTLTNKTFCNFKKCFEKLNAPYPGPKLMSIEDIQNSCEKYFNSVSLITETYTESYNSIKDFLKRIKLTGAGNPNKKKISNLLLKQIMSLYTDQFTTNTENNFTENYELCIVILQI